MTVVITMIMAIMVVSMMMIFMADTMVSSTVATQLAVANRNNIKADYLARSGKNLVLFLLSMDLGIDLTMYQQTKKVPSDGPGDVWSMLNGLPIGGDTVKMMTEATGLKLSEVNDSKVVDSLDMFDGSFDLRIEDEHSKININYCAKNQGKDCLLMLTALMSCPAEKEFLDRKKLEPAEMAANIRDWADDNSSVTEGANHSGESDPYEDRDPKVSPKNAPFDTLAELKQVAGWDDDMHRVFSPYLTVYPRPPVTLSTRDRVRVNINTANYQLLSCLVPPSSDECRQQAILATSPMKVADRLQNVSGLNGLKSRVSGLLCSSDKKKTQRFTYRSDVYRATITGEVGDQLRSLEMVIKRGFPLEKNKKSKFKGSYQFLHWKML